MEYRTATLQDLDKLYYLEALSYPEDEAASKETMKYRIENASDYFYVATKDGKIISFVNGTRANGTTLTHSTMFTHNPQGESLCVHSVVTTPALRRQGIGLETLRNYIQYIQQHNFQMKQILLLAKENLVSFYQQAGFNLVGQSNVVHGKEIWYEMRFQL